MRKHSLPKFSYLAFIYLVTVFFSSCYSTKNIKYFQNIPDTAKVTQIVSSVYSEPLIQTDDILTITVLTVDPLASQVINMGNVPGSANATVAVNSTALTQQVIAGYLVNKDGEVDVPVLGKIKLAGLTTKQATDIVRAKAEAFFNNPTVSVRFANFKVTVTGEVTRPATYVVPYEKVSILDALSIAGDLTIYGKRDNILLIREDAEGKKIACRVNLKSADIMKSPYFYLRQNDVIYVEPTKAKAAANDIAQTRNITIISGALSVLILLLTRTK